MPSVSDVFKVVPWIAHNTAARLDTLARQRGATRAAADRAGLLDQGWGIGGVAWPASPLYGQGVYRSRVIVLRLPVADVRRMLPANLSLATADADGLHPVLLFFGVQSDVRANIWPFPGWHYDEAVFAIADVEAQDPRYRYQGPFAYMPRLWLDRLAPVLAGVFGYGYAKTLARIAVSQTGYAVHDRDGNFVAEAAFSAAGPGGPPDSFPAWAAVQRLLEQPLLAEPVKGVEIGSVLSFRTHEFRRIVPLDATVTLAPGAVPHFAGGSFTAKGLDALPGAFEMESRWRITPPLPRGCLREAPPEGPAPAAPAGRITWAKPRRRHIAVLGGGVGALTAVWALTQEKDWQEMYDITVYQTGWRLGGKGASGRNAAAGQRIEEHGLHIWAGFYENAFRMMRSLYAELGRKPGTPLAGFDDAFKPHRTVTIEDDLGGGAWQSNTMQIPQGAGQPGMGEPMVPRNPLEYLPPLLDLIATLLTRAHPELQSELQSHPVQNSPWARAAIAAARKAGHGPDVAGPDKVGPDVAGQGGVLAAARAVAAHAVQPGAHRHLQLRALAGLARAIQRSRGIALPPAPPPADAPDSQGLSQRLVLHAIELALATLAGMIADGLVFRGFAAADHMEWRDWLAKHGASPDAVNSSLVRATYDYVFGFAGGDTGKPSLAAGTTTHGVLRLMLTYRGAFFWAMQSGMGDTIFGPLYQVLQRRGVRFEFFHRVRQLRLAPDGAAIGEIELARQARPLKQYCPLVDVKGLDSWPSAPLFDQLADGAALQASGAELEHADGPLAETITLQHGEHFDDVLLGISLGALEEICGELIAASPRWRTMAEKVKTVATLGVQLWVERDLAAMGWTAGETIATAYAEPLDTWASMSWLLAREAWTGPVQPEAVIYLCGTLPDAAVDTAGTGNIATETAIARGIAQDWLAKNALHPWPAVSHASGALDYNVLFREGGGTGPQRFAAQYFRANTRGSERYVQTVPGSTDARLRPGESGFDNLWLAGDWVRTGMNAGCVEAAAMGGLGAASAISSRSIDIVDNEAVPLAQSALEDALDTLHGVALTDALVVVISLDAAMVRALLPEGLELAPQALSPAGEAPVTIVLARHRHARLNIAPFGLGFRELLVMVPATRLSGGARPFALPGPYAYVARRVVDSRIMAAMGQVFYGDDTQLGRFHSAPGSERVLSGTGASLLTLDVKPQGARVRAPGARHFAEIDWLLGRPLLAKTPIGGVGGSQGGGKTGRWRLSRLDYRLQQACVQGLEVSLSVMPGLHLAKTDGLWRASINRGLLGSFRIWTETARSNPLLGLRRRPA